MKTLLYLTCTKLQCIGTDSAPIVLCVKDEVVLASGLHTLSASLLSSNEIQDDCGNQVYWRYAIGYDENLLEDPEGTILPEDVVSVFCESCFTDWLKELIAARSIVVQEVESTGDAQEDAALITGDVVYVTNEATADDNALLLPAASLQRTLYFAGVVDTTVLETFIYPNTNDQFIKGGVLQGADVPGKVINSAFILITIGDGIWRIIGDEANITF